VTRPLPSDRHLRAEGLREYLAAAVPALVPVVGQPKCFLVIDPSLQRVAIRVPWSAGELPDLSTYRHLFAETVVRDGTRWGEFGATGGDVLIDAYPVICAVADRVQHEGMAFASAVRGVVETYHELLRGIGRLSEREEVGLLGELLVLDRLIGGLGESVAISAWRGAISEEHDFGLPDDDLEVKTTTDEIRRHWVGTATQLEPTVGRPLWLLSLQVTSAGAGGLTLPELIAVVRLKVVDGTFRAVLEDRLSRVRWRDDQSALYSRHFRLRSEPVVFRVGEAFPAITPPRWAAAGVPVQRIASLSYLLDLNGLPPDTAPPALAHVTTGGTST
jgi:hypothetical protein